MLYYAQLFANHMNSEGVKFSEEKENVIKVVYTGDNLDSIPVYVFFDKDGDPLVTFKCWNIINFKSNREAAINACNEMNAKFRWIKFYIDDDGDIIAEMDAMIDDATCGKECLYLVRRAVSIIDDAYPTFVKARWA